MRAYTQNTCLTVFWISVYKLIYYCFLRPLCVLNKKYCDVGTISGCFYQTLFENLTYDHSFDIMSWFFILFYRIELCIILFVRQLH